MGRWIVAGLGNPGSKYEGTRHNAGAMAISELLERTSGSMKRHKSGCFVAEVSFGDERAVLARPISYMNESGRPVGELVRWYKVPPERLIVVHDELDVPLGEIRVKEGGGTAGHKGLRSIGQHLKSNDFVRVRVGISRPRGETGAVGHVLDEFTSSERRELPFILDRAADAVEKIVTEGVDRAMNHFNSRA